MEIDEIRFVAKEAQHRLKEKADRADIHDVYEKMMNLINYTGKLSQAKANSLILLRKEEMHHIRMRKYDNLNTKSSTIQNRFIDCEVAEKAALHELISDLRFDFSNAIGAYRTIIAMEREKASIR